MKERNVERISKQRRGVIGLELLAVTNPKPVHALQQLRKKKKKGDACPLESGLKSPHTCVNVSGGDTGEKDKKAQEHNQME